MKICDIVEAIESTIGEIIFNTWKHEGWVGCIRSDGLFVIIDGEEYIIRINLANSMMNKAFDSQPVTVEQLRNIAECENDTAVWIYDIDEDIYTRAIIDYIDGIGVVGIWCGDKVRWTEESDYGKTWLAYRSKPNGDAQ